MSDCGLYSARDITWSILNKIGLIHLFYFELFSVQKAEFNQHHVKAELFTIQKYFLTKVPNEVVAAQKKSTCFILAKNCKRH